ncbi:DUF2634 domain-containing protein [Dehalobacter sp. DCM]|uniref:DUF2634 domain-containing protein n=1 Tax=Dehalobacter sp. DCM TaxID=2907827 RepID=UPI003082089B|nr:DUF2634 domain-containing protein [Dehalobacter sp. DCM]
MGEAVFPFILDTYTTDSSTVLEESAISKEYAWDFDRDCFLMVDGKLSTVSGQEAIKIWAMKALRTPRYRYLAYSWAYGHELENLVGQSLSQEAALSEAKRYITEALKVNPCIIEVKSLSVDLADATLKIACTLVTQYGEVAVVV